MYNFEVQMKVVTLFEIIYESYVTETDRPGDGTYDRKVIKTERFVEWSALRSFAQDLIDANRKILQVVKVEDMTPALFAQTQYDS